MEKYHKIQSIYKRDSANKNRFIMGEWATPELDYLQNNIWEWTEKVDGTNVRIHWHRDAGRQFGGREDDSQLSCSLWN